MTKRQKIGHLAAITVYFSDITVRKTALFPNRKKETFRELKYTNCRFFERF